MPAIDESFDENLENNNKSNNNVNNNSNNNSIVISILHFNDCYNVDPRTEEPSGGAARLKTAFDKFKDSDPLVLFSGDIIAPSISQFCFSLI